jgi:hypothetical protein
MSRTYKDRPSKIQFPNSSWNDDYIVYKQEPWLQTHKWISGEYVELETPVQRFTEYKIPGPSTKAKKRKCTTKPWKWSQATPSWWTRLLMNKPMRHAGRAWERKVLFQDIEETDPPSVGRKPHHYYW